MNRALAKRFRAVAVAALVAMALSACVAIPDSGAVRTGDVAEADTDLPSSFQPVGPQKGDSPEKIVTNFIQAALSPQDNYAIARSFLASSVSQTWDPNARVTISTGPGTAAKMDDGRQDYSFTTAAGVGPSGVYTEEGTTGGHRVFSLVKVAGQWRIGTLEDGVVISASNFDRVFSARPLFFFEPSYRYLVPDVRWFPTTDSITTRIANALLAGPSDWLANGVLVTAFPPGTTLGDLGVEVSSGVATVDLSAQAGGNLSMQDRNRMQQQLTASLTSVANVTAVSMTVAGVDLTKPGTVSDAQSSQPTVNSSTLIGLDAAFGFTAGDELTPIKSLSPAIVALGPLGATYGARESVAAVRTAVGASLVAAGDDPPVTVVTDGTLVDPSLDNYGYAWTASRTDVSTLLATGADGVQHTVAVSSLGGGDARVTSADVSRDGARILLYLTAESGPRLVVAGILRDQNGVPNALSTSVFDLRVSSGTPVDATWESDRSVAAISSVEDGQVVTEYALGGPSVTKGTVPGAVQIVGGNGGDAGLRVLDASGAVSRFSSGTTWRSAGFTASFLATQQPG